MLNEANQTSALITRGTVTDAQFFVTLHYVMNLRDSVPDVTVAAIVPPLSHRCPAIVPRPATNRS